MLCALCRAGVIVEEGAPSSSHYKRGDPGGRVRASEPPRNSTATSSTVRVVTRSAAGASHDGSGPFDMSDAGVDRASLQPATSQPVVLCETVARPPCAPTDASACTAPGWGLEVQAIEREPLEAPDALSRGAEAERLPRESPSQPAADDADEGGKDGTAISGERAEEAGVCELLGPVATWPDNGRQGTGMADSERAACAAPKGGPDAKALLAYDQTLVVVQATPAMTPGL